MIGKVIKSRRDGKSSFYSLVRYIAGIGSEDKCSYVGAHNLNLVGEFPGTERLPDFVALAASEMVSTAIQNKRVHEPAFHAVVSWPEGEEPKVKQIEEAINIIAKNLNLEECQCVFAKHQNTEHTHLHIAFNRVHPETYRAIDPAKGWTKKTLEKAMREIEIKQEWGRELNGKHYTIVDDQVVPVAKSLKQEQSLIQEARDYEAHTGEESAQSKIREIIPKNFLEKINSWQEFNSELNKLNIVYEKKGSGAIFKIGGQEIKASNIAKKYGFSQLKKRLGTYLENENKKQNKNEEDKNENEIKINENDHRNEKERSPWVELRQHQQEEREKLKKEQQKQRKEKLQGNWKGKGAERNFVQSFLAVAFSKERKELMEKHADERNALKTQLDKTQTKKRKGRGNFAESTKEINPNKKPLSLPDVGIFGLEIIRVAGGAGYKKKDQIAPMVVDTGRRIRTTVVNEEAVLATLQLAAAKWSGCEIHGTKEYKALCVELAIKHHIKITNPELQQTIKETEKKREEKRQDERKQEHKQIKQKGSIQR